jgi:coenzyme F420-reducing hydrogenase beta subunit
VSDRQEIIRELAREALAEGRVDYFLGWGQGYDASQNIPVFVREVTDVDRLQWNPLCHHNLTVFLKRKMPDPPDARIGVCVKGCDSRTLVALLQEGLVDRDRLYIVGVPCDGVVDRRKIDREFTG